MTKKEPRDKKAYYYEYYRTERYRKKNAERKKRLYREMKDAEKLKREYDNADK